MIVKVDDVKLFELTDTQKKVIKNDIPSGIFDEDMKRRLFYIIDHKYRQCFKRLKEEWDTKLADNGVTSIPTDKDEYAELVFEQSNYKDAQTKKDEAEENLS